MAMTDDEIKALLDSFFETQAHTTYVGSRYVPIFGRRGSQVIDWDNKAPYEPLTVVLHEGYSFTSRCYVPTGIDITNADFWAKTGDFNAQMEAYRNEVAAFSGRIDAVKSDILAVHNKAFDRDTKNVVLVGDSYVETRDDGSDTRAPYGFASVLPTIATNWNITTYADGGSCFTAGGRRGRTFKKLIYDAYGPMTTVQRNSIDYVLICGGRNEVGAQSSSTYPNISVLNAAVIDAIKESHKFNNAQIIMFPMFYDWKLPNVNMMSAYGAICNACYSSGATVVKGLYSLCTGLESEYYMGGVNIHPNEAGATLMCNQIYNAVTYKNYNVFKDRSAVYEGTTYQLRDNAITICGAYQFDGSSNVICSADNLPSWLKPGIYNASQETINIPMYDNDNSKMYFGTFNDFGFLVKGSEYVPMDVTLKYNVQIPTTLN